MRWERRKPLWPLVAALGLLFVLALAAPSSWQSLNSRQLSPAAEPQIDLPASHASEPPIIEPVISQPPVVATQKLRQKAEGVRRKTQALLTTRPETLPVRREFDLDTLLKVRDTLLTLLDQLPAPRSSPVTLPVTEPALAIHSAIHSAIRPLRQAPQVWAPQVRVTSKSDRLAMLPHREPASRRRLAPVLSGPTVFSETTHDEVADFAAILLEASRNPKPREIARIVGPRLAMRPPVQKPIVVAPIEAAPVEVAPIEVTALAKPQAVEVEASELRPVKPVPVEPAPLRHRPLALVKQLQDFSASSPGAVWSQHVLAQIRYLTEQPHAEESGVERPGVSKTLRQLEQLYIAGVRRSEDQKNPSFNNQWQQAAQSLGRRLVLWRLLLDPEQQPNRQVKGTGDSTATTTLLPVLSELEELLDAKQNGNDWREYLLLNRIVTAMSEGIDSPALTRAKLAQEVLSRMADSQLTDAQREFLATPQLIDFHHSLRPWAAGKVKLKTLAALVERYESGRETRYAAVIAQLQQRLQWSDDPQLRALAAHLDLHYRGANMRLALSDDLLNRMMPKQKPTVAPVSDRIAGAKVRGQARTTTQLRVRLVPDPDAWHFNLEAFGKIYSDTRSDTWPARIRNAAKMQYQGHKEITLDGQGLHATPAQASAQGRNELIGVDSQLDPIPIVGSLLRNMARQKHKKSRPTALRQAKAKVVRQVKGRMDATLGQKLEMFEQKFRDKVLAPIEDLALLAEPLDMYTTQERAVMQLRLANPGQLAAHTLRPLAPSDSVLSLQMHETALNNAMMGLGLNGRRMTMLEVFDYLSERFGQPDATPPEDLPRRAVIQFAKRDALRVQCDGDRLELVLSVAELAHRRDKIKNFQIHVHFRPQVSGLNVKLVRDGTLQFSGRRLKTGPRVVLHSIMGKLLVKGQEINLVNAKLMLDPRFAGLMVTQLVIEDGWIGLALGPASPRRTAWRTPTPEVLVTPFVR